MVAADVVDCNVVHLQRCFNYIGNLHVAHCRFQHFSNALLRLQYWSAIQINSHSYTPLLICTVHVAGHFRSLDPMRTACPCEFLCRLDAGHFSDTKRTLNNTACDDFQDNADNKIHQEAQLMLTDPRDAFRGQSRSPNTVPFDMLGMVSY